MTQMTITKTSRTTVPKIPFEQIKNDILGKEYELSLVFVGDIKAKSLNQTYRKKDYVPNVLSFPLDKRTGEIFINPRKANSEAKDFSMTKKGYLGFLFIHACLHLKGYHHGATMEKAERRYCNKYRLG